MVGTEHTIESQYLVSMAIDNNGKPTGDTPFQLLPNVLLSKQVASTTKLGRAANQVQTTTTTWRLFLSDAKGCLQGFKTTSDEVSPKETAKHRWQLKSDSTNVVGVPLKAQIIPMSDINWAMGLWGAQDWQKQLAQIMGDGAGIETTRLSIPIEKISNKNLLGKQSGNIIGITVPRFRTILVSFSSSKYIDAQIRLSPLSEGTKQYPGQATHSNPDDPGSAVVSAICIPEHEIVDGFYRINVDLSFSENASTIGDHGHLWRKSDNPTSSTYELIVHLTFPLKSPLGDMQIVNGDPISLEEHLVRQYPDQYALYKYRSTRDKAQQIGSKDAPTPTTGALTLQHVLSNANATNKWFHGLLSASSQSETFWQLLDGIQSSNLLTLNPQLAKYVDLVVATKNLREKLSKSFANELLKINQNDQKIAQLGSEIADLKRRKQAGETISGLAGKENELKDLMKSQQSFPDRFRKVEDLPKLKSYFKDLEPMRASKYQNTLASKLNISPSTYNNWRLATVGAAKVASAIDTVNKVKGIGTAADNIGKAYKNLDEKLDDFHSLSQQYHNHIGYLKPAEASAQNTDGTINDFIRALGKRKSVETITLDLKFENDQHRLDLSVGNNQQELNRALQKISEFDGSDRHVIIEGHTSSVGSQQYNMLLSEKRARAVKEALAASHPDVPLSTRWFGEQQLVRDSQGKEDEAASRRVVIHIEAYDLDVEPYYYPCREAQYNLISACDASIMSRLNMQESWLNLATAVTDAVYDSAALVLRMFPATAVIGNAMVLGKDLYELTNSGATLGANALEAVGIHYIKDLLQYRSELDGLRFRSVGNQILMREAADRYLSPESNGQESLTRVTSFIDLQKRMRYEALNGLFGLLKRAANGTTNSAEYKAWLTRHKVEQYIETFIMSDNWLMPMDRFLPIPMDMFWLYQLQVKEASQASDNTIANYFLKSLTESEQIRQERFKLLSSTKSVTHGLFNLYSAAVAKFELPNMMECHAQRLFPLHYMASESLEEFANILKTDPTELNQQSVAHTAIYYRERHETEPSDWKDISTRIQPDGSWNKLSPFHPLCIVVILERYQPEEDLVEDGDGKKKQFATDENGDKIPYLEGYYPFELKQFRYDGVNVQGPSYQGLIRPLSKEDLPPSEHHWLESEGDDCPPRLGAVIHPFYQIGPVTHYGIRPIMAPDTFRRATNAGLEALEERIKSWVRIIQRTADAWDYTSLREMAKLVQTWQLGDFDDMRFGFELKLGNNDYASRPIRVRGKESDLHRFQSPLELFDIDFSDEFSVSIDKDRQHKVLVKDTDPLATKRFATIADEGTLLDSDFLRSGTLSFPYPKLFLGDITTTLLFRFGGKGEQFVGADDSYYTDAFTGSSVLTNLETKLRSRQSTNNTAAFKQHIKVSNFDWQAEVACMAIVCCDDLDKDAYNPPPGALNTPKTLWQKLPFTMQLESATVSRSNPNSFDNVTAGPLIQTQLKYLGHADFNTGQLNLSTKPDIEEADTLAEMIRPFTSRNRTRRDRAYHILGLNPYEPKASGVRHIFAAYHSFSYEAPTGSKVTSLRPFGKGHLEIDTSLFSSAKSYQVQDEDFIVRMRNLASAGHSGVKQDYWTFGPGRASTFLRINPPKSFVKDMPWVQESDKKATAKANANDNPDLEISKYAETAAVEWARLKTDGERYERVKKWMEEESELVNLVQPHIVSKQGHS
ncbi:MAG: OmpA family protein [Ketobacter sp.]|nr:OmpA family protein [Ketobacter sp.]